MSSYDKRDSRAWKTVKHGVYSPHPSLQRISLKEAERLGMNIGPELIISPRQKNSLKHLRKK